MRKLPSLKYLNEAFEYDPKTGHLYWKERPRSHFPTTAGWRRTNSEFAGTYAAKSIKTKRCTGKEGHIRVTTGKGNFYSHRIIWKMMTGEDPGSMEVDHKNTNGMDNRWKNLRLATSEQNAQNSSLRWTNTSGVKGVYPAMRKWRAVITIQGKRRHLGYFDNIEEAAQVIAHTRRKAHKEFTNHG